MHRTRKTKVFVKRTTRYVQQRNSQNDCTLFSTVIKRRSNSGARLHVRTSTSFVLPTFKLTTVIFVEFFEIVTNKREDEKEGRESTLQRKKSNYEEANSEHAIIDEIYKIFQLSSRRVTFPDQQTTNRKIVDFWFFHRSRIHWLRNFPAFSSKNDDN